MPYEIPPPMTGPAPIAVRGLRKVFRQATTGQAVEAFRSINDWGEGVRLPPIPAKLIDAILYERPFELLELG